MQWEEYRDNVLDYLEFLGYPDYVAYFNPHDVAQSIGKVTHSLYHLGLSYRMYALSIFGATWWKIKEGIGIDKIKTH